MEWILCKDCIYFEDCTEKESRDGCYHGLSEKDAELILSESRERKNIY